jgi:cytoskeletal protein RodZ
MQTIGERLEEARKRKGVSVREAAEATKIRSDYLQKFEANSFDLDLPPLYIRGFMRNYARFLDLDEERFIAEYDSVAVAEGRAPRRAEPRENYGRVEFAEGGEAAAGKRSPVDQAMLLKYSLMGGGVLVLLGLIILAVNLFTSRSETKSAQASPSAQTAIAQPPADGSQTLTFTALDNTRMKIVQDSDKRILFDGALARGETRTFRKTGKLLITTEKGSNLRMEVNGRNYPVPLDGYGRFALD